MGTINAEVRTIPKWFFPYVSFTDAVSCQDFIAPVTDGALVKGR